MPLLPSSAWASWWLRLSTKHLLLKHPFAVLFVQYILHFISSDKFICFTVQLKGSCSVNKKNEKRANVAYALISPWKAKPINLGPSCKKNHEGRQTPERAGDSVMLEHRSTVHSIHSSAQGWETESLASRHRV